MLTEFLLTVVTNCEHVAISCLELQVVSQLVFKCDYKERSSLIFSDCI